MNSDQSEAPIWRVVAAYTTAIIILGLASGILSVIGNFVIQEVIGGV